MELVFEKSEKICYIIYCCLLKACRPLQRSLRNILRDRLFQRMRKLQSFFYILT